MKKLISVRLEVEDYTKLLEVAKPFGGVGKWITNMLGEGAGSPAKANPLPLARHIEKITHINAGHHTFGSAGVVEKFVSRTVGTPVIKTKNEAIAFVKTLPPKRVQHDITCKCGICSIGKKG
jgi:hypothetical protein